MALLSDQFEFTRPQILTLTAGVLQLAFGWFDVFGLDPDYHVIQIGVGALGVAMAWRHDLARMYGALLLLSFGTLAFSLNDVTTESFLEVRTALIGLVITLAKPAKAAPK
jgi:methylmalonyl-CoA mutase N-terminal domain/subunit